MKVNLMKKYAAVSKKIQIFFKTIFSFKNKSNATFALYALRVTFKMQMQRCT